MTDVHCESTPSIRLDLFEAGRAVHVDKTLPGLRAEFLRGSSGREARLRAAGRLCRRVSADQSRRARR